MNRSTHIAAFAGIATLCLASSAWAVGKPSSPAITKGEWEVEYEGVLQHDGDDAKRNSSHELEVKYGVTEWFRPEFKVEYEDAGNESGKVDAIGLGAQFAFARPGEMWLDSALRLTYEHKPHDDADELKAKLLLQKQHGNYMHRANLDIAQQLGSDAQAGGPEWSVVWSSRYIVSPTFAVGLEYDGDFGRRRDFDEYDGQEHYVGPALYGKVTEELDVELGYLVGISDAAADGAVRVALGYEF